MASPSADGWVFLRTFPSSMIRSSTSPLRIPVASIPVYDTDPFKLNLNTQTFDLVV